MFSERVLFYEIGKDVPDREISLGKSPCQGKDVCGKKERGMNGMLRRKEKLVRGETGEHERGTTTCRISSMM